MNSDYIIINRESDWRRSMLCFMELAGGGVTLSQGSGIGRGTVYLCSIDSGENGFLWTRALIETSPFAGFVKLSAYASDNTFMPGTDQELDALITDPLINRGVKQGMLDQLYKAVFVDAKDVILALKGRRLWLKIDIVHTGGQPPIIKSVRVRLRGDHMIDHLPAVYRTSDDGFLYNYLSIFDSMVSDMEQSIYDAPDRLDYTRAGGDLLRFLSSWVGVDSHDESDDELRTIIETAVADYESACTPEGIKRYIRRVTGAEPIIIEYFQIEQMVRTGKDRESYQKLFGDEPNKFFVLLPESCFKTNQAVQDFKRSLAKRVPAHLEAELITLKQSVYLNWHTYLGVNTALGGYSDAVINEIVSIQYDTVLGGEKK